VAPHERSSPLIDYFYQLNENFDLIELGGARSLRHSN